MKKYDEKFHATRLIKMLEKKDICGRYLCPAGKQFSGSRTRRLSCAPSILNGRENDPVCVVCSRFVKASSCPCFEFGGEKAIKRTVVALKKGGYL